MTSLWKGMLACIASFGLVAFTADHLCLVYSETDSLPYHYFMRLKQSSPQKGQYTCFESPWYGDKVIKEIVGQEGDSISYDAEGVVWVGTHKIGKTFAKARDGRPLTPIQAGLIPEGFVFVKGNHARSFDSRYAELGLVPTRALQGRVIGLI